MKSWLRKNLFAICNACIAYSLIIYFGSSSLFFLGEPDFPATE